MKKILKGNKIAEKIKEELKQKIAKSKIKPGLAIILIGKNQASKIYTKIKEKASKKIGMHFESYFFKEIKEQKIFSLEKKIINLIKKLNKRQDIHGILVQLPLPQGLNTNKIIKTIDSKKDVDGFHPQNIKLSFKDKIIIPPVFKAIIKFLEILPLPILKQKKNKVLIIGKNKIFVEPLKELLEKKFKLNIDIYLYKKNKTQELKKISKQADILIIAIGKPNFIIAEMVKKESIIIDVGYNFIEKKSVGDVDFKDVFKKVKFITPVPGGIGPLTVAFLLENCYELASATIVPAKQIRVFCKMLF